MTKGAHDMAGETSLAILLRSMAPTLNEGEYGFYCIAEPALLQGLVPLGSFREAEGLTVILETAAASRIGLTCDYPMAWITLQVHSALEAVGLTAAFANALGAANISCNVIAGFHHDHLFVGRADAARAVDTLKQLADQAP